MKLKKVIINGKEYYEAIEDVDFEQIEDLNGEELAEKIEEYNNKIDVKTNKLLRKIAEDYYEYKERINLIAVNAKNDINNTLDLGEMEDIFDDFMREQGKELLPKYYEVKAPSGKKVLVDETGKKVNTKKVYPEYVRRVK